jgi:2-dehydropantoate 2-reductase
MELLIIGAGAIGVAVAATLSSVGHKVSLYARGETLEAIRQGGVHRTGLFGDLDIPPEALGTVSDRYEDFPPNTFDFVLICAKTMANTDVGNEMAAHGEILKKPNGKLVLLQNGWGNDAPYLRHFSKDQICSARVITGFQRTAPNVSNITVHTAPVLLGNLYGLDPSPLAPLAQALEAGGIPSQVTDHIEKALWAKMLYNCTLNPLGAVLGVHYGALGESTHTVAIMNAVIDEVFAVMKAAGYSTDWETPEEYRQIFYSKLLPDTYYHNSSTLQDIRKKQPTEIDTLTGRILALGTAFGVPVPVNTMLYRLVKAMEDNYTIS